MKACFYLPILALVVPVDASEVLYKFPATTKDLVHGLCTKGLTSVSATSNFNELTYGLVQNLKDGDPLWATDTAHESHSRFVGKGGFCEGGTFLQPSKHNRIPAGTTVSIQGALPPGADAQICYFVESKSPMRDGGWGQLPDFDYVKDYQWDATRVTDEIHRDGWLGKSKIYCRAFRNEHTVVEMVAAASDEGIKLKAAALDEGIKLNHVDGSADFPSGAVKVVSRDSSTVTVELKQAWASPVDKFFYQYRTNFFNSKCFEEDKLMPDALVDTITIQCLFISPFAELTLCLQDTTGDLLDPVNDQGTVSKCCHSDAPLDTPTVCYTLAIDCLENTRRKLRGLAHSSRKDI
jgi:hypothetical protein